jgi:hypothetical protein
VERNVTPDKTREEETRDTDLTLTTFATDPAAAGVDNSEAEPAEPTATDLRGDCIDLVRQHLWRQHEPPERLRDKSGPWTVGRELTAWKLLTGTDPPDDVLGAIPYLRHYFGVDDRDPASLRFACRGAGRGRWMECLQAYRKGKRPEKRRGNISVHVA